MMPPDDELFDDDDEEEKKPRRRGRDLLNGYGNGAFKGSRMSQTETALRGGKGFAMSPYVVGDVSVTLSGYETVRGDAPFPVAMTMNRWGFIRQPDDEVENDYEGCYLMKDNPHAIFVDYDRLDGKIQVRLTNGRLLLVFVTAGSLMSGRNPHEHIQLDRVMGRALRCRLTADDDLIGVCVPRSERFREITDSARKASKVKKAEMLILTVDRGGGFHGLEEALG